MTAIRIAECRCGQLTAKCTGEPVRVSVCHCLACQRRTGGPFAAQARFPATSITIKGESRIWERVADSGKKAWYHWCPDCGATVFYTNEGLNDVKAIPLGAFADPSFPAPRFSIYEERKHPWVGIVGDAIERMD